MVFEVKGDGNCGFYSILYLLYERIKKDSNYLWSKIQKRTKEIKSKEGLSNSNIIDQSNAENIDNFSSILNQLYRENIEKTEKIIMEKEFSELTEAELFELVRMIRLIISCQMHSNLQYYSDFSPLSKKINEAYNFESYINMRFSQINNIQLKAFSDFMEIKIEIFSVREHKEDYRKEINEHYDDKISLIHVNNAHYVPNFKCV